MMQCYMTGTLDKLESIPGYRVQLSLGDEMILSYLYYDHCVDEIKDIVDSVGCCIAGQTKHLCPADK